MSNMTAPDPSHVEWLRSSKLTSRHRLAAIADELVRKDARIGELQAMLEVGCDICGGAHHNNQHELLEQLEALQRRCGKAEALVSEIAAKDDRIAKLEAVVRNGIEHVESDTGAWGGWLVRAQIALRAGAPGGKEKDG